MDSGRLTLAGSAESLSVQTTDYRHARSTGRSENVEEYSEVTAMSGVRCAPILPPLPYRVMELEPTLDFVGYFVSFTIRNNEGRFYSCELFTCSFPNGCVSHPTREGILKTKASYVLRMFKAHD